jgi:hypothetical protein
MANGLTWLKSSPASGCFVVPGETKAGASTKVYLTLKNRFFRIETIAKSPKAQGALAAAHYVQGSTP